MIAPIAIAATRCRGAHTGTEHFFKEVDAQVNAVSPSPRGPGPTGGVATIRGTRPYGIVNV
jgi:hypothetical protein